jgi:AraC-like DNA-binding protein
MKTYFDYFPVSKVDQRWGIHASSFGEVHVPAGRSYPAPQHPKNHSLSWEKGRVLQEFQLLYISEGEGQFESADHALSLVQQGTLIVLFPGVWHRYRPTPERGWTEHWIELQGSIVESWRRETLLDPATPLFHLGVAPEILAIFSAAGHLARTKPLGFQVKLGLLGLQILPYLAWPLPVPGTPSQRLERIVQESLNVLASNLDQPLSPESIAQEFHVGYSRFRGAFKAQTGFSPKQYRLEIRFRRTADFLRHTDMTIKEISERLGYNSPYHLSVNFKERTGLSPQRWRLKEKPSFGR